MIQCSRKKCKRKLRVRLWAVGDKVEFRRKVFAPPYQPYYDEYDGHKFVITALNDDGQHIELKCITGNVKVKGCVHDDELRNAS